MDWRDSVLSAPQVPCGLAGLSTFAPPGTLEPGDWRDSVLSAPQVPHGLVGLSPFGHQVTLALEDMAGYAYQDIYIHMPWLRTL